jgi:heparanase
MKTKEFCLVLAFSFFVKIGMSQEVGSQSSAIVLSTFQQTGKVDDRFQSFNVEMCEVVGGDFWVPYHLLNPEKVQKQGFAALKYEIEPIDLYQEKLRMLAAGLGPTYVRVSGTWANTVYFQDNDQPKLAEVPKGFETVLTRKEWKGVIDFVKAVNGKLITSFAISEGIRGERGNWTSRQLQALLDYTKSIGGEITGAEMFNEPSHASHGGAPENYSATDYARDFAAFKSFMEQAAPEIKILGPGSTGEGGIIPIDESMATDKLFKALPTPGFDIFTYHFYGGVSQRCRGGLTPENALSADWLSMTELGLKYYEEARDEYLPNAPIWLTETAEAACGGDPWAATYLDSFRYVEQLGRLAKKGVQVVMHNTLAVSEYALLDQQSLDPRPNYWVAFLWNKLMGTAVYESDFSDEGVDMFVHNLKGSTKGYGILLVNPQDIESSVNIQRNAKKYVLTADSLQSKTVRLNGKVLELTSEGKMPVLSSEKVAAGEVVLPPFSISFLAIEIK